MDGRTFDRISTVLDDRHLIEARNRTVYSAANIFPHPVYAGELRATVVRYALPGVFHEQQHRGAGDHPAGYRRSDIGCLQPGDISLSRPATTSPGSFVHLSVAVSDPSNSTLSGYGTAWPR